MPRHSLKNFQDEENERQEEIEEDIDEIEINDNNTRQYSKERRVNSKKQKPLSFHLSKYKGIKQSEDNFKDEEEENEEKDEKDEKQEEKQVKISKIRKFNEKDYKNKSLNKENDNETENKNEDESKGKAVVSQQEIYYSLCGIRILLQEILNSSNKLPLSNQFEKFIVKDKKEEGLIQKLDEVIEETEESLSILINKIIEKSKKKTIISKLKDKEECQKDKITIKFSKKILNTWYKQTVTQAYRFTNKSNTITDFTENIDENINTYYDGFRDKTNRIKDDIIGFKNDDKLKNKSNEIYDDADFYFMILNDFLKYNQKDDNLSNDDKDMLENTMNFLKQKREKSSKILNHKASKNRKLRYDKHEKIVNFMISQENLGLFEGRDEFLSKLFGRKTSVLLLSTKNESLIKDGDGDDEDYIRLI